MVLTDTPTAAPDAPSTTGPSQVPKWKTAILTFAAVYPLSVLFTGLVAPHIRTWEPVTRSLLFPVLLVPLLTYVLMPGLTWTFRYWLHAATARPATTNESPS